MFNLFVESASTRPTCHLVLSARRRKKTASPQFVVALSGAHATGADLKRRTSNKIVATVVGNRQGTTYRCLAVPAAAEALATAAPEMLLSTMRAATAPQASLTAPAAEPVDTGVEIAAVRFAQAGVAHVGGVRQFTAVLPDPTPAAAASASARVATGSLLERQEGAEARQGAASEGLLVASTVKPAWDAQRKMHVMDFAKRVTQGSPKNCQLTVQGAAAARAEQQAVFLFGKNGKDLYAMDFAYPLTLVQAFSIAIACFDTRSFSG